MFCKSPDFTAALGQTESQYSAFFFFSVFATTMVEISDKSPTTLWNRWRRSGGERRLVLVVWEGGGWGDGGKERKLPDLGLGEADHPQGGEIPPLPPQRREGKRRWGRRLGFGEERRGNRFIGDLISLIYIRKVLYRIGTQSMGSNFCTPFFTICTLFCTHKIIIVPLC